MEGIEPGEIVVKRDAGIIDKHVECADLTRRPFDVSSVGHVEARQRYRTFLGTNLLPMCPVRTTFEMELAEGFEPPTL